ncbi:hypothetical protein P3T76_005163 [Phytophthora citrophthora]|uniref:Uncharacterized protein n=1 Tax=Phytophthora citrophthora TaxID=4793 RepID=A0AAD9GS96_9STRA|nr:hypothetical protein P3T76_005163 [Phytophthora citrophthora]
MKLTLELPGRSENSFTMAQQGFNNENNEFTKDQQNIVASVVLLKYVMEDETKRMQQQRERVANTQQELTNLQKRLRMELQLLRTAERQVAALTNAASTLEGVLK